MGSYNVKIAVVGQARTGKTNIKKIYTNQNFTKNTPTTHGVDKKDWMEIKIDELTVWVLIVDTFGLMD